MGACIQGQVGKRVPGRILATMLVSRQVLIDNSPAFAAELTRWLKSTQDVVDMEVETVASVEVCMRVLHDSLTDEMYAVDTKEVWHVIL